MKLKQTLLLASTALLLVGCGDATKPADLSKIVNYITENGDDSTYRYCDITEDGRVSIGMEDPETGINKDMFYFHSEDKTNSLRAYFTAQWKQGENLIVGSFYIQPVNLFVNIYETTTQITVKDHKYSSLKYVNQNFGNGYESAKSDLEAAEVRMTQLALDTTSEWLKEKNFPYMY